MRKCLCGCGSTTNRSYVSGHNLRNLKRTDAHKSAIASALRIAWRTKRKRLPIGTRRKDAGGYIVVKMVSGQGRWALEHVLVIERALRRKLTKREIVHHINGDRSDNRRSNLFLCRDRAHHNRVHRTQDRALRQMLEAGLVRFRWGRYEAVLSGRCGHDNIGRIAEISYRTYHQWTWC